MIVRGSLRGRSGIGIRKEPGSVQPAAAWLLSLCVPHGVPAPVPLCTETTACDAAVRAAADVCRSKCLKSLAVTVAVAGDTESRIRDSGIPLGELIAHFRIKCRACGHHRIMHDDAGKCEGVMNKPCTSGCDSFEPE